MKKIKILYFILGLLVASTTVYATYKYQAKDVGYTPNDSNFEVDNVDSAINELYNLSQKYSTNIYSSAKVKQKGVKGVVYLDPTNITASCTETDVYLNYTTNGKNGIPTGIKTGCMKWYIFDDSGDKYKMMLDHNTASSIQWNTNNINVAYESSGAYTSIQQLNWDSSLKTRIITAEEVNIITGKTSFDSSSIDSWYCFSDPNLGQTLERISQGKSEYTWLYDYTQGCTLFGCNTEDSSTYGYWTSTTVGNAKSDSKVWGVNRWFSTLYGSDSNITSFGIRPVITVSKDVIK